MRASPGSDPRGHLAAWPEAIGKRADVMGTLEDGPLCAPSGRSDERRRFSNPVVRGTVENAGHRGRFRAFSHSPDKGGSPMVR